ncbi:hypothetical protein EXIGLDRAFT_837782 [Exidia glandulosa HHB12029]|uniref:Uncharacterized protein n=1 Tax=Exidia glandulosa HHB12029 TaxID=1314781 RepID=A0A166ABQ5_EXIGL|nr:hypothetical protein EXIGLDRAFT_837782 [Exidia glandulosa HHB12029]
MDQPLSLDTPALSDGHTYAYDVPAFDPTVHCLINLDDIRRHNDDSDIDDSGTTSSSTPSQTLKDYEMNRQRTARRLPPVEDRDAGQCVFGLGGVGETKRASIICRKLGRNSTYIPPLAVGRGFCFGYHFDIRNLITLNTLVRKHWYEGRIYILATDERFVRDADVPQPLGAHPHPFWLNEDGRTQSHPPLILQFNPIFDASSAIWVSHRHQERAAFAGTAVTSGEYANTPCTEALHHVYAGGMLLRYLRDEEKQRLCRGRPAELVEDARQDQRRRPLTQRETALELQLGIANRMGQLAQEGPKREADDAVRSWLADCASPPADT